jgi:hypothetical protein
MVHNRITFGEIEHLHPNGSPQRQCSLRYPSTGRWPPQGNFHTPRRLGPILSTVPLLLCRGSFALQVDPVRARLELAVRFLSTDHYYSLDPTAAEISRRLAIRMDNSDRFLVAATSVFRFLTELFVEEDFFVYIINVVF